MYRKYFDFTGRVPRKEFWLSLIITYMIIVCSYVIETSIKIEFTKFNFTYFIILFSLIPSIGLCIRRLHDINKSGWWFMLYFIPIAQLWLIFLLCKKGNIQKNFYDQEDEQQFLGPRSFWIALVVTSLIIFACGLNHMHVSIFNLFISIVFISSGLLLFYILINNKK